MHTYSCTYVHQTLMYIHEFTYIHTTYIHRKIVECSTTEYMCGTPEGPEGIHRTTSNFQLPFINLNVYPQISHIVGQSGTKLFTVTSVRSPVDDDMTRHFNFSFPLSYNCALAGANGA